MICNKQLAGYNDHATLSIVAEVIEEEMQLHFYP
jgi:hypothetical protein